MSGVCSTHGYHHIGCRQCEITSALRWEYLRLSQENEWLRAALETALDRVGRDEWTDLIRRTLVEGDVTPVDRPEDWRADVLVAFAATGGQE